MVQVVHHSHLSLFFEVIPDSRGVHAVCDGEMTIHGLRSTSKVSVI